MTLHRLNPAGLLIPNGYTQVVLASGTHTIFIAGQVSIDAAGQTVGRGDFRAQVQQAFANLRVALEAAGARIAEVAAIRLYIVNYEPAQRAIINEVRGAFFGDHLPASTLLGVQALAHEDWLFELEATAVVDAPRF